MRKKKQKEIGEKKWIKIEIKKKEKNKENSKNEN